MPSGTVDFWEDNVGHNYSDQFKRNDRNNVRQHRWGNEMKYVYRAWLEPIVIPTGVLPPFATKKEVDELLEPQRRRRGRR